MRENKVTAFKDEEASFRGMNEIYNQQKKLYESLIGAKKYFHKNNKEQFSAMNIMDIKCFERELFLDPSECENPSYLLPQLGRDTFEKKGTFYRTDKILIDNFSRSFSTPSIQKASQ